MAASPAYIFSAVNAYVCYAVDTGWGTPGTPSGAATVFQPDSVTLDIKQNLGRGQALGQTVNDVNIWNGAHEVTGTISGNLTYPCTFTQYMICGKLSASGTGVPATPYEACELDNIGYTTGYCPTLTLQIGAASESTDDVMTANGVVITGWEISGTIGELVKFSCDWKARTVISSTTITAYTAPPDEPFNFVQATLAFGSGGTVLKCQNFSVKGTNEFVFNNELGTRLPVEPVLKSRKYDFSFDVLMNVDATATVLDAQDILAKLLVGTGGTTFENIGVPTSVGEMVLTLSQGAAIGNKQVTIDLEYPYFESVSKPINIGDGVMKATINGFARHGDTDSTDIIPFRWWNINA